MRISELIELLKQLPENDEVRILDADTDWQLPVLYVGKEVEKITEHSGSGYFRKDDMTENTVYFVANYFFGKVTRMKIKPSVALWRCKDYADDWIYFKTEEAARKYKDETGCLMQSLVVWESFS